MDADNSSNSFMASEFDKELKDLLSTAPQEQKKTIDSALTKGDFIKNSYVNYDEKNVNYVVNLYSKRIINALEVSSAL